MQTQRLKMIAVVDPLKSVDIKQQLCLKNIDYIDLFLATPFQTFMSSSPVMFEFETFDDPLINAGLMQKSTVVLETTLEIDDLQQQLAALLNAHHWQYGQVFLRWYSPAILASLHKHRCLLVNQVLRVYVPNKAQTQWQSLVFEQANQWMLFPLEKEWDAVADQCRFAYWLGVREEWQPYLEHLESAASVLVKRHVQSPLTQLELVNWSVWLAEQHQYLNHPQFIQICLQQSKLAHLQHQVNDWRKQFNQETNYV